MSNESKVEEFLGILREEEELRISNDKTYSDGRSAKVDIVDRRGLFRLRMEEEGGKILIYDQIKYSSFEYRDLNLALDKVKEMVSERNPIRNKDGSFKEEGEVGKTSAWSQIWPGCLQLLPVVVALGLLIAIAQTCN